MAELESFVQTLEGEFQLTMRLFNCYPAARLDYRPHEKSFTARERMKWTRLRGHKHIPRQGGVRS
jgi:hypothetical protein